MLIGQPIVLLCTWTQAVPARALNSPYPRRHIPIPRSAEAAVQSGGRTCNSFASSSHGCTLQSQGGIADPIMLVGGCTHLGHALLVYIHVFSRVPADLRLPLAGCLPSTRFASAGYSPCVRSPAFALLRSLSWSYSPWALVALLLLLLFPTSLWLPCPTWTPSACPSRGGTRLLRSHSSLPCRFDPRTGRRMLFPSGHATRVLRGTQHTPCARTAHRVCSHSTAMPSSVRRRPRHVPCRDRSRRVRSRRDLSRGGLAPMGPRSHGPVAPMGLSLTWGCRFAWASRAARTGQSR